MRESARQSRESMNISFKPADLNFFHTFFFIFCGVGTPKKNERSRFETGKKIQIPSAGEERFNRKSSYNFFLALQRGIAEFQCLKKFFQFSIIIFDSTFRSFE